MTALTQLGQLNLNEFFADYWQKKPVVLRNALPNWQSSLEPDDLAGLALEQEIESRLVFENQQGKPWQLKNGPFTEADFSDLGDKGWSLLVQAVDQWVPEVSALLNKFRFIPNWQLDDVMVSYAPDGASVGPHYDHYDVFLVQGLGQRHWKIGQHCDDNTARLEGSPLKIVNDFDTQEEFVLEPGDVLYVPAQIAHWGIAKGDCMTYSIGFRAPAHSEILDDFFAEIASKLPESLRFKDNLNEPSKDTALITEAAIDNLQQILQSYTKDREAIGTWFGKYMTQEKYFEGSQPAVSDSEYAEIEAVVAEYDGTLEHSPSARFAYRNNTLFVSGEAYPCDHNLGKLLAGSRQLPPQLWRPLLENPSSARLIYQLLADSTLCLGDPFDAEE